MTRCIEDEKFGVHLPWMVKFSPHKAEVGIPLPKAEVKNGGTH